MADPDTRRARAPKKKASSKKSSSSSDIRYAPGGPNAGSVRYAPGGAKSSDVTYAPGGRNTGTEKPQATVKFLEMLTRPLKAAPSSSSGGPGWLGNLSYKGRAGSAGIGIEGLMAKLAGSIPSATVQPNLVDIASLVKPYQEARAATQGVADQNRARIAELAQRSTQDNAQAAEVAALQAAAAGAQQRDAAAATRMSQETDARAAMAALAAQGVDPSMAGDVRSAADQAIAAAAANRSSGQDYTNQLAAEAKLDASRRAQTTADQNRAATTTLDQNLLAAMVQLNSQEAQARAQAEQANAAAANEANVANAGYARQALQDRVSLADAIQSQAQAMDGYVYPQRDAVMAELGGGVADDAIRQAFSQATNPNDALDIIGSLLEKDNQAREGAGLTARNWDMPWIEQQVKRFYQPDTSRVTPDTYRRLLNQFSLGAG